MNQQKTFVGGQAVMEGVMMRSPGSLAVVVRRENGEIVVREDVWRSIWDRLSFLRWPFLRGSVVMVESMINGMQALDFSAREAMSAEEREKEEAKAGNSWSVGLTMIVGLVLAIALFKGLPHLAASYSGLIFLGELFSVDDLTYHVIDGGIKIVIFVLYLALIGLMPDIRRVFMYHGAEHMAIATYEADEDLVVENARLKSTLHPRCGTAFLMVVILVFIVVAAAIVPLLPDWVKPVQGAPWYRHVLLVLFKLPLLIPVAGVAYEFNRFAGRHVDNPFLKPLLAPGLAMQLLTTRRPDDGQLEIALASLKTVLWRESIGEDGPRHEDPLVFPSFAELKLTFSAPSM